jgi:hypothetical protein
MDEWWDLEHRTQMKYRHYGTSCGIKENNSAS